MDECLGDPLGCVEQEAVRQMGTACNRDGMSVAEQHAAHIEGSL